MISASTSPGLKFLVRLGVYGTVVVCLLYYGPFLGVLLGTVLIGETSSLRAKEPRACHEIVVIDGSLNGLPRTTE